VREARKRFGRAIGDALPVGLPGEEVVQQGRDFGLLDQPAGSRFGDVAGQAKRSHRQLKSALFQKTGKRADEFKQDVVHVEDQEWPVV
jgi:hypothetical protein